MSTDQAPAACSPPSPTATACDQVLSLPRSRACITTPRSIAARRRPETRNSRATINATSQPGKMPYSTSAIIVERTSTLSAIGSSSVPKAEERPLERATRPSNQSVVMATAKTIAAT